MNDRVRKMLEARVLPDKLQKYQDRLLSLLKCSRSDMSKYYDTWDRNRQVFRGEIALNEDDIEDIESDQPPRMAMPMSYAQIQTFVTFIFLLYKQNPRFFQLKPTGDEDFDIRDASELVLEMQLAKNDFSCLLYQWLINFARMGLAPLKTHWSRENVHIRVSQAPEVIDGIDVGPGFEGWKEVVKYEGNRLTLINPYHWFYDTRKPLSDWAKGEFVADEQIWSEVELKRMEQDGMIIGLEHVSEMNQTKFEDRLANRFNVDFTKEGGRENFILTEVQHWIVPEELGIGPETHRVLANVIVLNDDRIVGLDYSNYIHSEFTHSCGILGPDGCESMVQSLSDVMHALQETITYLTNTRMASIKRSLVGKTVIHADMVDLDSLDVESPYILVKKAAPRVGVRAYVEQLPFTDVTQRHMEDVEGFRRIMQFVTGVNENAMGQYHSGRRSATEARQVTAGGAARMKTIGTVAYESCWMRVGSQMLSNCRDGLSLSEWLKIVGNNEKSIELYNSFHPFDREQLVGANDFFVFDSTLSAEKGFMAQSLQELLSVILSSPEVLAASRLDPIAILQEIQKLRGVTNVSRFEIQQAVERTNPGLLQNASQAVGGV